LKDAGERREDVEVELFAQLYEIERGVEEEIVLDLPDGVKTIRVHVASEAGESRVAGNECSKRLER
jgi:hypothetical protein